MKTSTQVLTLSLFGFLAAMGFARPALADHRHDHLQNASHAASEVAAHARHVQLDIRSASLSFIERRDLTIDAAQLELAARRLQAYARIGDVTRAQVELTNARNLARHLAQHARDTNLGYSYGFREELSEIFHGLSDVESELAAELDHYRPHPSAMFGVLRPRVVYSFVP